MDTIPADWKTLIARWFKRGEHATTGCRWDTLAKDAGPENYPMAQHLLDWLVSNAWVALIEERRHGDWWPIRIEFLDVAGLRLALGLPDPEAHARRWSELRATLDIDTHPDLAIAMAELDSQPLARSIPRAELLMALAQWRQENRTGTRRDFALAARATTKAITDAEWRWLDGVVDLAAFGIERHTPLLLIAAPLVLNFDQGTSLDLSACADFAAVTPATIAAVATTSGTVTRWRLVENRTSFERVARIREADTAVVWLPGYPPNWWQLAIMRLLEFAPAPAEIACDPDPSGIAIALHAAESWDNAALAWQPWRMSADDLAAMPVRQPLTGPDRALLARLIRQGLPSSFNSLANWMDSHSEKGEQEGFL